MADFLFFIVVVLWFGILVDQLITLLRVPLPYTVVVLLFGWMLGAIGSDRLGELGRSMDELTELSPDTILLVFLPILILEPAVSSNCGYSIARVTVK
jgi:hypothetical protein